MAPSLPPVVGLGLCNPRLDLSHAAEGPVHIFPQALEAVGLRGGRAIEEDARSAPTPQTRCRPMEGPAIGCPKEKNSRFVTNEPAERKGRTNSGYARMPRL
jgi:hypothetical protein